MVVIAGAVENQDRRPTHAAFTLAWNSKYMPVCEEEWEINGQG